MSSAIRCSDRGPVPAKARTLAWASLVCWFGAIVTRRLLAYVVRLGPRARQRRSMALTRMASPTRQAGDYNCL